MAKIALISCTKDKLDYTCPAIELYINHMHLELNYVVVNVLVLIKYLFYLQNIIFSCNITLCFK